MTEETRNVFISHIHEDDDQLPAMKELLGKAGFQLRDSSVNSSTPNNAKDPDYIKTGILAPSINWAGTVVVLISSGTHRHEWVDWEIEYAHKQGKRIVGVWAHGASDSALPDAFKKYGDALVGWQADRIADAIAGKINNWETSTGGAWPARQIARYGC